MLKVLVTGAAGLIGGEVCARLVARGHAVTALVRRTRVVRGNDGGTVPVAQIVIGDATHPFLGLDPAGMRYDLLIHCAASLEFDAPEADLHRVNVDGTRHALAFARATGAQFLHVSTAYVCGQSEGPIREGKLHGDIRFANGYEASKARGEREVEISGVPFAIARPSITLGESDTGAIREFPSLCNVLRLMARGKVRNFPVARHATLDLVPIDHVAGGIVAIAERISAAQGGYFHLCAQSPLPAAELAHAVSRVSHFPDPVPVNPECLDLAGLPPAERRVIARMWETFGSYLSRDPRFDDSRFRALTGLCCPPTDSAWIDRLVAYAIDSGYLPPPSTARADNAGRDGVARPAPTSPPL